jgi:cobalt-zinc-cadmium efflux system protein
MGHGRQAPDAGQGPAHPAPADGNAQGGGGSAPPSHSHTFAFHVERAKKHRWRLGVMAFAMGTIALVELVGGLITGSLALLADAAHAATDSLALFLALFATHLVTRAAHAGKTFGYHRAEILAAFANAVVLVALAVFIVVEAVGRLVEPRPVDGLLVTYFGVAILLVEVVGIVVLKRIQGESLNARSAFLHLLGDLVSTLGVITTGVVIHFGGAAFLWSDPVVSVGIALLLGYWALRLIRETGHILMEGTPVEVDAAQLREALVDMQGIESVHDLHVWTLTSGLHSMSVHIVADHHDPRPEIALVARRTMAREFGLEHVTIQVEDPRWPCEVPHE